MPTVLVLGPEELVSEVMDALADDSPYPLIRFTQDARERVDWFVLCAYSVFGLVDGQMPARTTLYLSGKLHRLLPAMVEGALGPERPLLPVARQAMNSLSKRIAYHSAMLAASFALSVLTVLSPSLALLFMLASLYHTARLASYLACFSVPILECGLFQGPDGLLRRAFAAAL